MFLVRCTGQNEYCVEIDSKELIRQFSLSLCFSSSKQQEVCLYIYHMFTIYSLVTEFDGVYQVWVCVSGGDPAAHDMGVLVESVGSK